MSVYKNLAFGLETARLPRSEIDPRVRRAAEILRIDHPRNRFVAGFIGSPKLNFLDARIDAADAAGAKVHAGGSEIALPRPIPGGKAGEAVTFGVRPEHIDITEGSGVRLADVRVDLVEQLGGATMLYTTTADNQPLTIAIDGQRAVDLGTTVSAYVDPARYNSSTATARRFRGSRRAAA